MTYKNTIVLLIGILLITLMINAQTVHNPDKDSTKIKSDCEDVRIEQRAINNELKEQLNFLKNILEEEVSDTLSNI